MWILNFQISRPGLGQAWAGPGLGTAGVDLVGSATTLPPGLLACLAGGLLRAWLRRPCCDDLAATTLAVGLPAACDDLAACLLPAGCLRRPCRLPAPLLAGLLACLAGGLLRACLRRPCCDKPCCRLAGCLRRPCRLDCGASASLAANVAGWPLPAKSGIQKKSRASATKCVYFLTIRPN